MMKYVALLRGINVGGNNKVSMDRLKQCFETAGLTNAKTYVNSGNVIFESNNSDVIKLIKICEQAIEKTFGFKVICTVISSADLLAAIENAPWWWGNNDHKHNAIFVIPPASVGEILDEVGETNSKYEKVQAYQPILFWSAPADTIGKTRYSKLVGSKFYKSVTIRNANTTRKLAGLCESLE